MVISHHIEKNICVISIIGRVVGTEVSAIKEYCGAFVGDENIRVLLLSLKEVSTLDSAGIGLIVELYKGMQKREAMLAICNPKESHQKIFDMIRLNKIFSIYATEEEALSDLSE